MNPEMLKRLMAMQQPAPATKPQLQNVWGGVATKANPQLGSLPQGIATPAAAMMGGGKGGGGMDYMKMMEMLGGK